MRPPLELLSDARRRAQQRKHRAESLVFGNVRIKLRVVHRQTSKREAQLPGQAQISAVVSTKTARSQSNGSRLPSATKRGLRSGTGADVRQFFETDQLVTAERSSLLAAHELTVIRSNAQGNLAYSTQLAGSRFCPQCEVMRRKVRSRDVTRP